MKKFISVILMAALALSLFAACGKTEAPKGNDLSGETCEALVNKIYETKMPEFALMTMPVDLADAETTAWLTGVSDPALLTEAVVNESMMGWPLLPTQVFRQADFRVLWSSRVPCSPRVPGMYCGRCSNSPCRIRIPCKMSRRSCRIRNIFRSHLRDQTP